jgi:hypothetical protein
MGHKLIRRRFLAVILSLLIILPAVVQADDGDYDFDNEKWKEYLEFGYLAGTWLPCRGPDLATCTWVWKPWYQHGTQVPQLDPEPWAGRTVHDHALIFYFYAQDKNIHGGVFRRESVEPCHIYRFSMWARSGLDLAHPASTNARMQVGISPTGDYPDRIVLTTDRIDAITWSPESNSRYAYEQLFVEAEAQADTVTVFTRAHPDPNNQPYTFWDQGSFTEVRRTDNLIDASQPLPTPSGRIQNVQVFDVSSTSARISWNTGAASSFGQVLYRQIGAPSTGITSTVTLTNQVFLPLVLSPPRTWQYSVVDESWQTTHQIQLTGLQGNSTYEFVVVSYGYFDGVCQLAVSETSDPWRFDTP